MRIGDASVLPALRDYYETAVTSAERADADDARIAILARMELRGEETDGLEDWQAARLTRPDGGLEIVATSWGRRWRAIQLYTWAQVLLFFRMHQAGTTRLEKASTLRPEWATPVLALGMAHARRGEHALRRVDRVQARGDGRSLAHRTQSDLDTVDGVHVFAAC